MTLAASEPQRVIVTGGRHYNDVIRVYDILDSLSVVELAHGNATGADRLADEWCKLRGIPCTAYPANWRAHGRSAGPRRNAAMLAEFNPDLVVAFTGGVGTAHMVKISLAAGYRVLLADPPDVPEPEPTIFDA